MIGKTVTYTIPSTKIEGANVTREGVVMDKVSMSQIVRNGVHDHVLTQDFYVVAYGVNQLTEIIHPASISEVQSFTL